MPGMAASAAESLRGRALQSADAHLCLMWVTLHHGVVGKPAVWGMDLHRTDPWSLLSAYELIFDE